jgi:DNA-binding SARP family transcriptional activator
MYDIRLFGHLRIQTRGVSLTGDDLGGERGRDILALLALHGPLRKEELTQLLWAGNPPADHATTLDTALAALRHRLDPELADGHPLITTSNDRYALTPDNVRVDVARFDELVAAASRRTASRAMRPLTAAAHLAGRPLLEDVEAPEWAAEARERYRARVAEVHATLAAAA